MKPVLLLLLLVTGGAHGQRLSTGYYLRQSRVMLDQNKVTEAEAYADSALVSAIRSNELDSLMTVYLALYEVHSKMGDYHHAIGDFRMASVYRDSIMVLKGEAEVEALKSSLAVEREMHQKEIAVQAEELSRLREEVSSERRFALPVIGGLFLLLILSSFMIYRDKKRLQLNLEQSESDNREGKAYKEKLFTLLSYDLSDSLSAFERLTHGLAARLDNLSKEETVQFLNNLHETAGDLKGTLNNVIQWVSLQANAKPCIPLNFDCKALAAHALEKYKLAIAARKLKVDVFIPDGQMVYADREMIEIVLGNLVSNAIHFTAPGGSITCFSGRKNGLVTLGVKDTGLGIAKEDIEKLFRTDIDSKTIGRSSHKGAGVGLILSRELVEKNGGRMYVESVVGEGSTFYFTLPEKKD